MYPDIYDIIGIGIGPFNLGLAALVTDLPELKTIFFEQKTTFDWHPGLLLPTARMQVPYYADLVTIVNPQSPFTYTNFLQKTGRFFKFANHDNIFPLRIEYNRYCQWVVVQLPNLQFGQRCVNILHDTRSGIYKIELNDTRTGQLSVFHAKHLVIGTGTLPCVPPCLKMFLGGYAGPLVLHAADYLKYKSKILQYRSVTVLGSGQSAAEIFQDLLPYADELEAFSWFSRSTRFHPMDYSRFTTEMTSMDYIDHFYELDPTVKEKILADQQYLYKGINARLIAEINDALYIREVNGAKNNVQIRANCELLNAGLSSPPSDASLTLHFKEMETPYHFQHPTQVLIAATGYEYKLPTFMGALKDNMEWNLDGKFNVNKNYSIDRVNTLFVQNADLHSHGFNSADLGMGPYRNATILNSILGKEHFILERNTTFQSFTVQ